MATLTDYAYAKMLDLYKNHSHEVGSSYPGDKTGKQVTDCITYVQNVIRYAYTKVGKPEVSKRINFAKGTDLATYLVGLGWRGCYWNPDVRKPRDQASEHPFSHHQAVKTGKYYGVKVKSFAVNYNLQSPTPKAPNNTRVFRQLSLARFAYGIARGGYHTFLLSFGSVYEVHWDQIGAGLYEKSPFYTYEWLSGALLFPPKSRFVGDAKQAPAGKTLHHG
jgi:hypothetical protein